VTFAGNRPPVWFTVHDKGGEEIARVAHFERALTVQKAINEAEDVRRVPDGAVVATKKRLPPGGIYGWAWRLKHEPGADQ
jgi:hypothetical protein